MSFIVRSRIRRGPSMVHLPRRGREVREHDLKVSREREPKGLTLIRRPPSAIVPATETAACGLVQASSADPRGRVVGLSKGAAR